MPTPPPDHEPRWTPVPSSPTDGPTPTDEPTLTGRYPAGPWLAVALLAVAVMVLSGLAGLWAARGVPGDQITVTVLPSKTPWPLVPPIRVGDYSRDPNVKPSPRATAEKSTTTATYSKGGTDAVILLLSRPETKAEDFLRGNGLTDIAPVGDSFCGVTADAKLDGCVVLADQTAVLVVGLQGQTRDVLMGLAGQFAGTLSQG